MCFGDVSVSGSGEVIKNWDAIKRDDRNQKSIAEELRGVSKYLPQLMRAEKIQKKAEKAGYTDPHVMGNGDNADCSAEQCGQMLFATVQLCRKAGVDPELALKAYTEKFIDNFEKFETGDKDEVR